MWVSTPIPTHLWGVSVLTAWRSSQEYTRYINLPASLQEDTEEAQSEWGSEW